MSETLIRYDLLTQNALRGVVRQVLVETAKNGLPGEHHFFISFQTTAEGVKLPQRLIARFPKEMTIVLQYHFDNLTVNDAGFEVGLSFDGIMERIAIPFAAVKGFYDPSVEFGMQFEIDGAEEDDAAEEESSSVSNKVSDHSETKKAPSVTEAGSDSVKTDGDGGAQVLSLDRYRKK